MTVHFSADTSPYGLDLELIDRMLRLVRDAYLGQYLFEVNEAAIPVSTKEQKRERKEQTYRPDR